MMKRVKDLFVFLSIIIIGSWAIKADEFCQRWQDEELKRIMNG